MKSRFFISVTLLILTQTMFSQVQPFGHLTVFSEDGDAFYLIINGEEMNDEPQTNIRVEELLNPHYNVKIIFKNESLKDISKNFLQIADLDGIMSDVTYKIKRNKNRKGKMKLSFFSSIPVVQGFVAPANVYVRRFGHPAPPNREVVVIREEPQQNTSVNTNVNLPGVNVNVSINEPVVTETVIVEEQPYEEQPYEEQPYDTNGCTNAYAMSNQDFNSALTTVKNAGYDQTALQLARQISSSNCMSVNQIKRICELLSYEASKLEFAKFAYDNCTEPNNYFKVNDVFDYSDSKNTLSDYIQNR
ncbi:MAG: DUF4476 domain-containing protein [Bacteroidota bacterium]